MIPNIPRRSLAVFWTLAAPVLDQVAPGSKIYTDEVKVYRALPKEYTHEFVNHVEKYVNGRVHTNGLENFWSLLKRGLNGTYVAVEPFHLHRYLDEQMFRYNNRKDENGRKLTDAERFTLALSQIAGKRLTAGGDWQGGRKSGVLILGVGSAGRRRMFLALCLLLGV